MIYSRLSRKNAKILSLIAALSVMSTHASADTLTCKMTKLNESGGYIPREIVIEYEGEAGEATLIIPKSVANGDINDGTKIAVMNGKRITFKLDLKGVTNSRNQFANFNYRLTWIKKNNKGIVVAQPLGYPNQFKATGICKKST